MNKDTIVAIVGGGNGAHAAAVDLTLKGFRVRLFEEERFAGNMESVFKTRRIAYDGALGKGEAIVSMVTSNLAEALDGAGRVIVSVPAFAHSHYAGTMAPLL